MEQLSKAIIWDLFVTQPTEKDGYGIDGDDDSGKIESVFLGKDFCMLANFEEWLGTNIVSLMQCTYGSYVCMHACYVCVSHLHGGPNYYILQA